MESRYTVERFLGGIGDPVLQDCLIHALRSGYQLEVRRIEDQAVPAVLILAAYALHHEGAEIVDDYERLVETQRELISPPGFKSACAHPDLFMASCIVIQHAKEAYPSYEGFDSIRVPELFNQMVVAESAAEEEE